MKLPYGEIVGMQAALAGHWVNMMLSVVNSYTGILDPRPDLAKRAREGRAVYSWWW
jgi:hypothetical protein